MPSQYTDDFTRSLTPIIFSHALVHQLLYPLNIPTLYLWGSGFEVFSLISSLGFPGGSDGKSICLQCGRPGLGRYPEEGNGNPLHYSCLENPMDEEAWQSPWGLKKSDTTERLHFLSFLSLISSLGCPVNKLFLCCKPWHLSIWPVSQLNKPISINSIMKQLSSTKGLGSNQKIHVAENI